MSESNKWIDFVNFIVILHLIRQGLYIHIKGYIISENYPLAHFEDVVKDSNRYLNPEISSQQAGLNRGGYELISERIRSALDKIQGD